MPKIVILICAVFLLPFYPFLKTARRLSEKIRIGEKVIVVLTKKERKQTLIS